MGRPRAEDFINSGIWLDEKFMYKVIRRRVIWKKFREYLTILQIQLMTTIGTLKLYYKKISRFNLKAKVAYYKKSHKNNLYFY